MYTYDDSFCYLGREDLKTRSSKYLKILSKKIIDISQNTSRESPYYKVIHPISETSQLKRYHEIARQIKENFSHIIVIGMGGSTLNPQSILNLIAKNNLKNIYFLNNTDLIFFKNLIESVELSKTAFLTISNSGETLETIALIGMVLNEFKKKEMLNYDNNFYFITNLNNSTIYKLAISINAKIFSHETEISGRYASFTNVTTLIGLIAELDMDEFLAGGNEVLSHFWREEEHSLPARAAITIMSIQKPILVNLGYLQKFSVYLDWYSQIIGESLGKDSKGFTPLKSLAPNDHHSMLQLYLDGPRDKLFTMFYVKQIGEGIESFKVTDNEILGNLINCPLERISNVIFHSALNSFKVQEVPVRTLILDNLSARSVGGLIAHSMVEVILLACLLEVNPFNQPAVESIKTHAKQLILT